MTETYLCYSGATNEWQRILDTTVDVLASHDVCCYYHLERFENGSVPFKH